MAIISPAARFAIAETVLSVIGAGIAGTLWWAHRNSVDLPCTANGGCAAVAASEWSRVTFGPVHDIPVALLGFVGYLLLLTIAMAKLGSDSPRLTLALRRLLWLVSGFGTSYSWRLQYIAHFEIDAFCIWCFSSALVMTALFATATWELATVPYKPNGRS